MGRNKTILWLHELTGVNYSILRKSLKANGWDPFLALCEVRGIDPDCFNQIAKEFAVFANDFVEGLRPIYEAAEQMANTMIEALKGIDWEELNKELEAIENETQQHNDTVPDLQRDL